MLRCWSNRLRLCVQSRKQSQSADDSASRGPKPCSREGYSRQDNSDRQEDEQNMDLPETVLTLANSKRRLKPIMQRLYPLSVSRAVEDGTPSTHRIVLLLEHRRRRELCKSRTFMVPFNVIECTTYVKKPKDKEGKVSSRFLTSAPRC
jgi:hypothetical protein